MGDGIDCFGIGQFGGYLLNVYNTITRKKEEFKPIEANKVKMYVCGVTVYDYCHLGHARALITFDLIYRTLCHLNYDVTFVRNFTDIDDKIIKRSHELGMDWRELTTKFIQAFRDDTAALGLKTPTHEPLATDHISEIIQIIQGLKKAGLAYESNGDVFYSVRSFKDYGKLSGKNIEELESGARVDVMDSKKDPLDFALWKSAKPGEPFWPSPWGNGRPGWHIECSAMSMKYLSETFDIHGGGRDLIFPHHENEIAQSEGCTQKPFAKYWLHNGFVNINAEKMSKSLDNFLTIRDILKQHSGEVIRCFILSAHYRSPLDYADVYITEAASALERFYEMKARLMDEAITNKVKINQDEANLLGIEKLKRDFVSSLSDDFNSAKVIGMVFEWVRQLNKAMDDHHISAEVAQKFLNVVDEISEVLGIFGADAHAYLKDMKTKGLAVSGISEDEIKKYIDERKQARQNKDFKRSDEIRDLLKAKGIQLKDSPDGRTTWTVG